MARKRFFCLIVALFVCSFLGLSFLSVDQAAAKKITIKAISAWPTNDNSVKIDYLGFVAHVNKKIQEVYPDEFEIRYIGGPEAIPTRDQADALRVGTVDMYFGTPAYYVGMAPAANTSKMTQLTPWEERDSGAAALFDEIHRNKLNSVYLGRLGTQIQFQLFLNKQVQTPDDLKGMRIRVSPMYIDFVKALGATPIETAPGDIYQGLERGVFDGTYWPYNKFREWGFHEVAKYIVGPGIYDVCHPVLINLDTWNKIPVRISGLITAVMMEEERAVVARDYEEIKQETEGLKAAGLTFIEFSPADAQRYIDLSQSSGWEGLIQRSPEWGPTLQKLLSK